jgi:hypothetical protein
MEREIVIGEVLSESSHYIIEEIQGNYVRCRHFEGNSTVNITKDYVDKFLKSATYYDEVIKVGKEDKKDGTLGIRSIWENIHSSQVFTVCFKKQDKLKSNKKFNEEVQEIATKICEEIDKVKSSKKGVAEWAKRTIHSLMSNPISKYEEGEDRILRGYKIQFESRDGRYNCVDMDIVKTDKESGVRPVNINTIKWLIYNNKKYIVE